MGHRPHPEPVPQSLWPGGVVNRGWRTAGCEPGQHLGQVGLGGLKPPHEQGDPATDYRSGQDPQLQRAGHRGTSRTGRNLGGGSSATIRRSQASPAMNIAARPARTSCPIGVV